MSITDREPDLPVSPPRAIASIRGAFKLLVHDPVGEPSKGSHDEWHAKFVAESAKLIPGWAGALALKETPEPTPDTTELLLLTTRTDGKAWPALTGKRLDFLTKLQRLAAWAQQGRLIIYGAMPSPAKLIRSPAIDWDVASKEQWASWWDAVWPQLQTYGSMLESPRLVVGDECAWAFAQPGDMVVAARGISPMGLNQRLRSVLASRESRFSRVDICVGLSWAESQTPQEPEYYTNAWNQLCQAYWEMSQLLNSEGYGQDSPDIADIAEGVNPPTHHSFIEPPHCAPDTQGSKLGPFSYRNYARGLVVQAAQAYMPLQPLPEGAWQEPELPGQLSPRHVAKTGAGVEPKSRMWSPSRAKKKDK
jgi:hypothetical protein